MTIIRTLAQREAQAEAQKGKADEAWRKAWWGTTLALGDIPADATEEVREARLLVQEITGQSDSNIRRRTKTGRAFKHLEATLQVNLLPPSLALETANTGVEITEEIAESLAQAERDGITYRAFLATLPGGRGAYHDTPAGMSAATIQQIVETQPDVVAEIIAASREATRAVNEAMARTPIGRDTMQGVRRGGSETEAQAGPKVLRSDLRTAAALMELAGWLDTIVEEYERDEEGADTARLIVQAVRYRCDMVEAWAGGHLEPLSEDDFEREMAALLGNAR